MPHVHGSWGHYVRPGKTDPKRGASYYAHRVKDDAYMADSSEEYRAVKDRAAKRAAANARRRHQRQNEKVTAAAEEVPLIVKDIHGNTIYSCNAKRGNRVREFLISALPPGSFAKENAITISLRKSLAELGFKNKAEFEYWCAHQGERK